MIDETTTQPHPTPSTFERGTVTRLDTHRRKDDVLCSMTFFFGGTNHGTISISAPYTRGMPIVLYVVPQQPGVGDFTSGPLDCLLSDDFDLAADLTVAT
jgi:hypothetical protein